jgi:hypothetical protein
MSEEEFQRSTTVERGRLLNVQRSTFNAQWEKSYRLIVIGLMGQNIEAKI